MADIPVIDAFQSLIRNKENIFGEEKLKREMGVEALKRSDEGTDYIVRTGDVKGGAEMLYGKAGGMKKKFVGEYLADWKQAERKAKLTQRLQAKLVQKKKEKS